LSILLGSEIRGDLLTLFHRNPGLVDTLDGVARRIGRKAEVIEDDVDELVNVGILRQKRIGSSEVILLDRVRDRQLLQTIASQLNTQGGA
jgi:hypothetical protein